MNAEVKTGKKPFFGWWIVVASFLIMATCYTIFVNCMSIFQPQIVGDLGITVGEYNTATALSTVFSIVGSLVVGGLIDKVSGRILGSVAVIIAAAVLLLFSQVTALWQIAVLCSISGFAVVAGLRLFVSLITSNWFTAKRGLAISIGLAGSGFGGAIMSPVATALITSFGWRTAMVGLAIIVLIVAFIPTVLTMYSHPSDKGLKPYGSEGEVVEKKGKKTAPGVTIAVGWKNVVKNPSFWLILIGFAAMGIVNGAILPNQITNMTQVTLNGTPVVTGGHELTWASGVLSAYLITVVIAKISLGAIYDRWGLNAGNLLGTVACVVACIALCFPATDAGPIIAAISFGIGTCMGTVTPTVMCVRQYGSKDLGRITGWVTAVEMVGAMFGAIYSGVLFDQYLTFAPMWIICLVASIVMGVTFVISTGLAKKLVARLKAEGAPELDAEGKEIAAEAAAEPEPVESE